MDEGYQFAGLWAEEQRSEKNCEICRSHDIRSLHENFETVLHLHQPQSEGNDRGSEIAELYVKDYSVVQIIFVSCNVKL